MSSNPVPDVQQVKVHAPGAVLAALALGGFAIGTTEFASMSLLPDFAAGLGVDAPTAGHAISAYALGVVVGAPVIAVLAARLPRRIILVALMAVFAVGNLLSALAPTFGWMMAFRFFSGLPHGAYFGVAALVAASVAPPERRAQSVAMVMIGLTVATIVGVPMANVVGQWIGWRWGFVIVAILAAMTATAVYVFAPRAPADAGASPLRELGALAKGRVWLTLGIGAIGFGGMFCVYTYLASTMREVTHASAALPVVLAVFGAGMTVGTLACAWAADRAQMPAIGGVLLWSAAALALYPMATGTLWTLIPVVFLIGCGGGLGAVLQTRLMDVAGDAQTLAAALNHSAFNFANALGPWLGGLAIAAGMGWTSTGYVGAALALGGFTIWVVAALDVRRERLALAAAE
ncbi:MFS transporter [Caulobacter sp. UNC358MFTsu5.1]|uniref:MFS transporter n=1 Tax=Caulobacter sp. UNC358MFTsu5.1 TaxID=1449049 RepID=UPI000AA8AE7E|nr:MFS transporter [Caulobacter sp. UNC358MFTsu5.1]